MQTTIALALILIVVITMYVVVFSSSPKFRNRESWTLTKLERELYEIVRGVVDETPGLREIWGVHMSDYGVVTLFQWRNGRIGPIYAKVSVERTEMGTKYIGWKSDNSWTEWSVNEKGPSGFIQEVIKSVS